MIGRARDPLDPRGVEEGLSIQWCAAAFGPEFHAAGTMVKCRNNEQHIERPWVQKRFSRKPNMIPSAPLWRCCRNFLGSRPASEAPT